MILAALWEGEEREKFTAEAFASESAESILAANRDFVLFAAKWLSPEDWDQLPQELRKTLRASHKTPLAKARDEVEAMIEMLENEPQEVKTDNPHQQVLDALVTVARAHPEEGIALFGKLARAIRQAGSVNRNLASNRRDADVPDPMSGALFDVMRRVVEDDQADPLSGLRLLHLIGEHPEVTWLP
jgi:hypothetical protein